MYADGSPCLRKFFYFFLVADFCLASMRDMLSDASVERQCQLCAQDISKNYDEERLEEFVKESRQTPSPDDWAGKMGEDEA